jgi:hypothetical protein
MQINVSLETPAHEGLGNGSIVVGWLLNENKSSIIYDPPTRVRSVEMNRTHAKSASRCPAIISLESRYFEVKCPFDLNLAFVRDEKGKANIKNLAGETSPIRGNKLREALHLVEESEWRHKDRPTIQLNLPYLFICDEPVYIQQTAPFMHYAATPWPGTIFGGRFPINVWPRPLMWAFEWHDITKPLVLKRGDPLFYATFETSSPERPIQLVEAEHTKELDEFLQAISGAVNYVNQSFSLFKAAEQRRPARLITPKLRS